MKIKLMYKIHALSTARGEGVPQRTTVFFETLEEAIEKAECYISNGHLKAAVIYKAHVLVRPRCRPMEVMSIECDGEIAKLSERLT